MTQERKRKILFIEEVNGLGGSNTCLSYLISALTARGYDCLLVLYFRDEQVERRLFPGIKTYHLTKYFSRFFDRMHLGRASKSKVVRMTCTALLAVAYTLEAVRRVAITYWIIRVNRVDVVHTNNSLGINFFSILAARLARVPCVCHFRSFGKVRHFQGTWLKLVARIVTVSEGVKDELGRSLFVNWDGQSDKLVTIYDGLTERELSFDYINNRDMRREYGLTDGTLAVGIVGMLTEWKGVHVFLAAARIVIDTKPGVMFFVVGDSIIEGDPYREFLRTRAAELGITDRLVFTGFRSDTMSVYASLDIVVHASLNREPFGRVVIEAMAAARPVVAAGEGGPAEIIIDGETGLLYKTGDAAELAAQILLLINDPGLSARIGSNARKSVEERFSMDVTVRETERVYEGIGPR